MPCFSSTGRIEKNCKKHNQDCRSASWFWTRDIRITNQESREETILETILKGCSETHCIVCKWQMDPGEWLVSISGLSQAWRISWLTWATVSLSRRFCVVEPLQRSGSSSGIRPCRAAEVRLQFQAPKTFDVRSQIPQSKQQHITHGFKFRSQSGCLSCRHVQH